jgi:hypothetical protein
MKNTNYSYFLMFKQVQTTLNKHKSIWENNPLFVKNVSKLGKAINIIHNAFIELKNKNININKENDLSIQPIPILEKLIKNAVIRGDTALKKGIDLLMDNYIKTYPSFADAYRNAREITVLIDPITKKSKANNSYAINGQVTSFDTNVGIAKVIVIAGKKNKRTTTDKEGMYSITITKKNADDITFIYPDHKVKVVKIPPPKGKKQKQANAIINAELKKMTTYHNRFY